jgi:hypothetical protein
MSFLRRSFILAIWAMAAVWLIRLAGTLSALVAVNRHPSDGHPGPLMLGERPNGRDRSGAPCDGGPIRRAVFDNNRIFSPHG